jgi:hypothetical protein
MPAIEIIITLVPSSPATSPDSRTHLDAQLGRNDIEICCIRGSLISSLGIGNGDWPRPREIRQSSILDGLGRDNSSHRLIGCFSLVFPCGARSPWPCPVGATLRLLRESSSYHTCLSTPRGSALIFSSGVWPANSELGLCPGEWPSAHAAFIRSQCPGCLRSIRYQQIYCSTALLKSHSRHLRILSLLNLALFCCLPLT